MYSWDRETGAGREGRLRVPPLFYAVTMRRRQVRALPPARTRQGSNLAGSALRARQRTPCSPPRAELVVGGGEQAGDAVRGLQLQQGREMDRLGGSHGGGKGVGGAAQHALRDGHKGDALADVLNPSAEARAASSSLPVRRRRLAVR